MATSLTLRQFAAIKVLQWTGLVQKQQLASVQNQGGWWPIIRESFTGAWQQNTEITVANVTTNPTIFACVTLIASDIAKMRVRLVQDLRGDDVWSAIESPAFSPVLDKPNHFQDPIQFYTS